MNHNDKAVKVEAARAAAQPTEAYMKPLVDVYETPAEVVMVAELPGAARDDISIQVDRGMLTLQARSRAGEPGEGFSASYIGFESGKFYRAFALSDEIDRDKISAEADMGLLTLRLPKAESAKSRKIEIKTRD